MTFGEFRRPPSRRLAAVRDTPAQVLPLWPERWHVVFEDPQHPLWISPGDSRFYRRCLRHFIARPYKALCAEALLWLNRLIPRAGVLTEVRLPRTMRRMLAFELAIRGPWRAAIRIGTAGPRQRASVVLASDGGDGIAFAKVAMTPAADARVAAEADNLRQLAGMPHLAGRVPRLLGDGTTLGGRRYFITTLAPGTRRSTTLTPAHIEFLGMLGRSRLEQQHFGASICLRRIESMLARLQPCADRDTRVALWEALRDCVVQLSGWNGPFVMAQGDFAPWNVCACRDGVFVYDWERARSDANPLTDLLSFSLAGRALCGPITARALAAVVRVSGERMRQLYPEWMWRYPVVAALTLACLIETMLQRCLENECFDAGDPVVRNNWRLIEARSTWLAPF